MENPIKMDDLGVPLFLETPIFSRFFKHLRNKKKRTAKKSNFPARTPDPPEKPEAFQFFWEFPSFSHLVVFVTGPLFEDDLDGVGGILNDLPLKPTKNIKNTPKNDGFQVRNLCPNNSWGRQGTNSKAKAFKIKSPKDWVAANQRHPI